MQVYKEWASEASSLLVYIHVHVTRVTSLASPSISKRSWEGRRPEAGTRLASSRKRCVHGSGVPILYWRPYYILSSIVYICIWSGDEVDNVQEMSEEKDDVLWVERHWWQGVWVVFMILVFEFLLCFGGRYKNAKMLARRFAGHGYRAP